MFFSLNMHVCKTSMFQGTTNNLRRGIYCIKCNLHSLAIVYVLYTVLKTTFLGDRFFVHYLSAIFKACPPNVTVKNKNLNNCHTKSTKLHNLPRTQSGPGRWDFPTGPCVSLFLYIYIYLLRWRGGRAVPTLCLRAF